MLTQLLDGRLPGRVNPIGLWISPCSSSSPAPSPRWSTRVPRHHFADHRPAAFFGAVPVLFELQGIDTRAAGLRLDAGWLLAYMATEATVRRWQRPEALRPVGAANIAARHCRPDPQGPQQLSLRASA